MMTLTFTIISPNYTRRLRIYCRGGRETIHSLANSGSHVSVASLVEQGRTSLAELIPIEIGATGDVVDEGGGEQSHTQSHHWEMVVGPHTEKCL